MFPLLSRLSRLLAPLSREPTGGAVASPAGLSNLPSDFAVLRVIRQGNQRWPVVLVTIHDPSPLTDGDINQVTI
jgi:hypothetical protein